ncbi:MAG: cysteine desulfurase [Crocinitomicaceae bacterium]|nr:cysteine desulfurase [Crocinitomicaceae bacterium]MCF8445227.1 cysteine desulfurase [Crocinitomicaceae bacterium]
MNASQFNPEEIRAQFPILQRKVNGKNLVYFDNGATAQKPQLVIDSITKYYSYENANIHRGVHLLSQEATNAYENARNTIQSYIRAAESCEIIFTKGTTDSINLVAFSLGETLHSGDEILISYMEHHSNIVPWQMLCERKGLTLKVIPIHENGELNLEEFEKLLSEKTKLLSITHVSNTLGTINPVEELIKKAHAVGAKVLIDGAQSIQHFPIDVQALDCDFFVFSGHKVFGPTGVGILYGKKQILESLPPYQGGGDMIAKVSFAKTTYNELPHKFEAGTPHISGGISLGKAFEFMQQLKIQEVIEYEHSLLVYAEEVLSTFKDVRIIGNASNKASVVSFVVDNIHPFDIGTLMDKQGIAVRTGHHCTQPLMDFFQIPGTIRASFALYNTKSEIDLFATALDRSIQMLK